MDAKLIELVKTLQTDRVLANRVLFPHRHGNTSAPFHAEMVLKLTGPDQRVLVKAFRGSAKSTNAEEVLLTEALFKFCHYGLIISSTYDLACLRLASIKHEANNEKIISIFGNIEGDKWGEDVVTLSNGVRLQAMGRGQSVRGLKDPSSNSRPDFVLIDDLETPADAATPESREKTWRWLTRELMPALDPNARLRMVGTPLHEDSAVERVQNNAAWHSTVIPIYIEGPDGGKVPTWPSRFPLEFIEAAIDDAERDGDMQGFSQEYLCKPIHHTAQTFKREFIQIEEHVPRWTPRTLIVDPARTTKATSSRTGYTVVSWVGARMIVHEALGGYHTPFDQVEKIFELCDAYHPMTVAVEANGLEEWLMQPLRAEAARRGVSIPIEAIRAPRDKKQFITGLEPFFRAGEVVFAKPLPDLEKELLAFPFGKLDVVNALAYAPRMRPGAPIYPAFDVRHVRHFLPSQRAGTWLAVNATPGTLISVLVAVQDGSIHVLKDWVREGPLEQGLRAMQMDIAAFPVELPRPQIIIPAERASSTDAAGLGQALKRASLAFRTGKRAIECVESLTASLASYTGKVSDFTVSPEATYTLNALAGGYAREVTQSVITLIPQENIHRYVAQAVEVLAATIDPSYLADRADSVIYATSDSGRRYISMKR